jgi:transposase
MQVLHQRCAGLDVHSETVVACARIHGHAEPEYEKQTFPTHTAGLLALSDWLARHECTHVAMEATGVYWKPVWHVLEGTFQLVLANAQHVRNVPGRKSDASDSEWLSDLLAHGLIRSSFVAERPMQELRDLTRTRKQLVREVAQHTQRLQKVLEDANIKMTEVVASILGQSGRSILEALIQGENDPEKLAALALGRLKAKRPQLAEALRGRVTEHHRFMLRMHLDMVKSIEGQIEQLDARIGGALEPFRESVERLKTIPGISDLVAQVIIAEIGTDMGRFATASHLRSWAGLCPRSDESAGKRRSTRLRKGAPWLKTTMVQAAWSAARTKDSYLRAQFIRLKSKRGPKKAIMAVAASMLTAIYHMLRDGLEYKDLGANYFTELNKTKTTVRLVQRLQALGYDVKLSEAA